MIIYNYQCRECNELFFSGWGGNHYAVNQDGQRELCGHPLEASQRRHILDYELRDISCWRQLLGPYIGKNHLDTHRMYQDLKWYQEFLGAFDIKALLLAKSGYLLDCLCMNCGCSQRLDFDKDPIRCKECGLGDVRSINDCVGEECPNCREGIVERSDTGWVT